MERYYDVTIYEAGCKDFDNEGICGPLFPTACYHDEEGNAGSEVTLEHPFDDQGKWREISAGRILKCWVQNHIPPEINEHKIITSVERWTVKATATSAQRAMYNKQSGGKKLKTLPKGLSVTVVKKPENGRYKIKSSSHGTGYVDAAALEYETDILIPDSVDGIESAEPGGCITWQLFEITKVKKKDDSRIVANAHAISYQLLTNCTTWKKVESATIGEALDGIMGNCLDEHEFSAFTDMDDARAGIGWAHLNPVKCMLDPENGVVALFPCELVRDNWDLYFLSQAGRNRGVRIEPGKNMEGVEYDEDMNGLYTHIMPIGHTKSGEELYLPEVFVVSPLAEAYHRKFIYPLECTDCDVGKNGVTEEIALNRMREQAQKMLDGGCDVITRSVKITMAALTGEAGGQLAAALEAVLLYDYVTALHPDFGIDLITKIVRRRWDCLRGRLISVEMGTVAATLSMGSLASWQIPNGVSGSKIIAGTIGSSALQDGAISTRHLQTESINTEALQAEAVTAEKIKAGSITAKQLAADAISAELVKTGALEAVTAKIEKLTASDIYTDRLAAALAAFTVVTAGTAEFDRATIEHLVANLFNLTGSGVMEDVFIHNLQLAYAQIVSASIGSLVLQDKNGGYYEIGIEIREDGTTDVTASQVFPTEEEKINGVYGTTKPIIATQMTVDDMAATTVKATQALINKVIAARIDVDELFANKAFIQLLTTSNIVGGESITIIANKAQEAENAARSAVKTFRQTTQPLNSESKAGDLWIHPDTGAIRQADSIGFVVNQDGVLYLEHDSGDGYAARISPDDPFDLETNFETTVTANGAYSNTPKAWRLVQDQALQAEIFLNGTSAVDLEYCLWTSETEAPAEDYAGWDTTAPSQFEGLYIWSRTATRLGDGSTKYGNVICLSTSLGKGVAALVEQYAVSTSKITAPEDGWVDGLVERDTGEYIWMRTKIIYIDGSVSYTEPYCDTSWEAASEAQKAAANAGEIAAAAVEAIGEIPNYVEIKNGGLYLKDEHGASTLKINSASVNIGTVAGSAADGFSQFTASYVQFGNTQLRRTADGGLAFKMR